MNACFFRTLLVLIAAGLFAPAARAQFGGLDKLKKLAEKNPVESIKNKVPEPAKKAIDSAPDAAKIAKAIDGIGAEEERLIGESVALEIIGKYGGIVRDEAIARRVNLVGQALAYYSSRPVLNWRFAVLESPSVNGFSAPGGIVFITRGLFDLVSASDDALAAVLAHEIAHITQKHALKIISRNEGLTGFSNALAKNSDKAARAQATAAQFDTGIADFLKKFFEVGFDPDTEYAADKFGRNLALTTGYAPGALRQILVQLQLKKGDAKQIFSTHPSLASRVKNLPSDPMPKPAAAAPAPTAEAPPKAESKN
jgi:beta-barrel assembly-enhancing protease